MAERRSTRRSSYGRLYPKLDDEEATDSDEEHEAASAEDEFHDSEQDSESEQSPITRSPKTRRRTKPRSNKRGRNDSDDEYDPSSVLHGVKSHARPSIHDYENKERKKKAETPPRHASSPATRRGYIQESQFRTSMACDVFDFLSEHWRLISLILFSMFMYVLYVSQSFGEWRSTQTFPDELSSVEPVFDAGTFPTFSKQLDSLSDRFPQQSGRSWTKLRAAMRFLKFTDTEMGASHQPSCVLFYGAADATTGCLSKLVQSLVGNVTKSKLLDIDLARLAKKSTSGSPDPNVLHSHLQHEFESKWHTGKTHVARLTSIDALPAQVALPLLHQLCDNDNAPRKRAVLLMTVEQQQHEIEGDNCEEDAEEYLTNAWRSDTQSVTDKLPALWSRIGNHVICVRSEDGIKSPDNC